MNALNVLSNPGEKAETIQTLEPALVELTVDEMEQVAGGRRPCGKCPEDPVVTG